MDDKAWDAFSDTLLQMIDVNLQRCNSATGRTAREIHTSLMKCLKQSNNVVFVRMPGVQSPSWPASIKTMFYKNVDCPHLEGTTKPTEKNCPNPEKDYIYVDIRGTTFSGLSTRTTFGNTFRSLAYIYYYLHTVGITEAWKDPRLLVIASGDDVVIFFSPELEDDIR